MQATNRPHTTHIQTMAMSAFFPTRTGKQNQPVSLTSCITMKAIIAQFTILSCALGIIPTRQPKQFISPLQKISFPNCQTRLPATTIESTDTPSPDSSNQQRQSPTHPPFFLTSPLTQVVSDIDDTLKSRCVIIIVLFHSCCKKILIHLNLNSHT